MNKMTKYPEFRTVRWVDDNGNEFGSCEYVRKDRIETLERENARLREEFAHILDLAEIYNADGIKMAVRRALA